ncbi:hypothetical protein OSTOST_21013 [Ostertagia ostertagi]
MRSRRSTFVTLLREGFTSDQILKKIRMEYRNKKITAQALLHDFERHKVKIYSKVKAHFESVSFRRIATRNKMEPGRKHAFDLQFVEMRINENSEEDGIQRYVHATNETGDGFLLIVITPVQKSWLTRYSRRGISIDDTFNLTRRLCYFRMTEQEVFELFSVIKKIVPDFDPMLLMTDDTNSFHNGFIRAFPQSAAVKLLCNFHVLQAIKRCKAKLVEVSSNKYVI